MKTGLRCVCILWMVSLVALAGSAEKLKAGPGILEKAWTAAKENPWAIGLTVAAVAMAAKYIASRVAASKKPVVTQEPQGTAGIEGNPNTGALSNDGLKTPSSSGDTGAPHSPVEPVPPAGGDGVRPEDLTESSK